MLRRRQRRTDHFQRLRRKAIRARLSSVLSFERNSRPEMAPLVTPGGDEPLRSYSGSRRAASKSSSRLTMDASWSNRGRYHSPRSDRVRPRPVIVCCGEAIRRRMFLRLVLHGRTQGRGRAEQGPEPTGRPQLAVVPAPRKPVRCSRLDPDGEMRVAIAALRTPVQGPTAAGVGCA
jgi:hypothetical protein